MNLYLSIALKFLFHATKKKYLSVFTLVSVLGIALSVFIFIFIDSIITGLSVQLKDTLLGFEAPVMVRGEVDLESLDMPFLVSMQFDGLVSVKNQGPLGVRVRSAGESFFDVKKDQIDVFWLEGYYSSVFAARSDLILIGEGLYEKLGVAPYDDEFVILTHPFADLGPTGELEPMHLKYTVAGVFYTGRLDFDEGFVLISSLAETHYSPDLTERVSFIFPEEGTDAAVVKAGVLSQFPELRGKVMTWFEKNEKLFRAMRLEKLMYFLIFVFILFISCFNLGSLVAIFTLGKIADSAVLRTMGMSLRELKLVFANMGFLLGGVGTIIGVIFGVCSIFVLKSSGLHLPKAYGFTELPLYIRGSTVMFLVVLAPLFCGLISFLPAQRILKKPIVEVLSS